MKLLLVETFIYDTISNLDISQSHVFPFKDSVHKQYRQSNMKKKYFLP